MKNQVSPWLLYESSNKMQIPRIIHQTFSLWEHLPVELQKNVQKIKEMNPGWEYRFYDNMDVERFIKENFNERILSAYLRIDPAYGAAKADFFRYLCLYRNGGVYLDIKSTISKPLDSIIRHDDSFLLSQWENSPGQAFEGWGIYPDLKGIPGGEYQQWFIVSMKEHPFLKAVIRKVVMNIETYDPYLYQTGKLGVITITGPIAYTLAIFPLLNDYPHRFLNISKGTEFHYSIYYNENEHNSCMKHEKIYKKTHYGKLKKISLIKISAYEKIPWHAIRIWRRAKRHTIRMGVYIKQLILKNTNFFN